MLEGLDEAWVSVQAVAGWVDVVATHGFVGVTRQTAARCRVKGRRSQIIFMDNADYP
jgi:hypothetical protein